MAEEGTPFGFGGRACVGRHLMMAQLTVLVALLVRHYRWSVGGGGARGGVEPWVVVPAPRPKEGLAGFVLGHASDVDAIPLEFGD